MSDRRAYAERIGKRLERIVWCCTCDRQLGFDDVGPFTHIDSHPGHYVIEVTGELHVWRTPKADALESLWQELDDAYNRYRSAARESDDG